MKVPVIVGNTVTFNATRELMETGVGRCPDRRRSGRGLHLARGARPGCSAGDCDRRLRRGAAITILRKPARYVPIITDGGMSKGATSARRSPAGRMP